jgi:hypothetical protein
MNMIDKISEKYKDKHSKTSMLIFYYTFERFGMIIGPGLTSMILIRSDFSHTLLYLGIGLFTTNLIYATYLIYTKFKGEK